MLEIAGRSISMGTTIFCVFFSTAPANCSLPTICRCCGQLYQATTDHTLALEREASRVVSAGGWVEDSRIFGILQPTRGVGDLNIKLMQLDCLRAGTNLRVTGGYDIWNLSRNAASWMIETESPTTPTIFPVPAKTGTTKTSTADPNAIGNAATVSTADITSASSESSEVKVSLLDDSVTSTSTTLLSQEARQCQYESVEDIPPHELVVSPVPEIRHFVVEKGDPTKVSTKKGGAGLGSSTEGGVLVLASDGVWDFMSNETVMGLVRAVLAGDISAQGLSKSALRQMKEGYAGSLKADQACTLSNYKAHLAAKIVCETARERADNFDDVTCVVVVFK